MKNSSLIGTLAESSLEALRASLEESCKEFPTECAMNSAKAVNEIFGLPIVGGYFVKDGVNYPHFWNITLNRKKIVDLTADQFGKFPKVYIIDSDSKEAEEYEQQGEIYS